MSKYQLLGLLLLPLAFGAEWRTSNGLHCTSKCLIGERYDQEEVYWCPVTDGVETEWESKSDSEEDKLMWDYCTPGPEALERKPEKPVTLPAEPIFDDEDNSGGRGGQGGWGGQGGGQGGQGGYYPGGEEAMENPRGVSSSLPGHMCTGPCETLPGQTNFTCKIGVQPGRFACSQEVALRRTQIGSRTKLWCISGSDCAKQQDGVYRCRTMLGWDECSPSPAHDSQGNQCRDTCHEREVDGKAHYKCNGSGGLASCGFWGAAEAKKKGLEFTTDDQVCAGPCVDKEGEMVCPFVKWQWDEEEMQSRLVEAYGNCGEAGWGWVEWVILVAGILGGILVIGIVAFVVSKKGYTRAATSGA